MVQNDPVGPGPLAALTHPRISPAPTARPRLVTTVVRTRCSTHIDRQQPEPLSSFRSLLQRRQIELFKYSVGSDALNTVVTDMTADIRSALVQGSV